MAKSKIEQLPVDAREEIEDQIIQAGYTNHDQVAEWARQQGYDVTRDNIYRHALKLKEQPPGIQQLKHQLEQSGIVVDWDSRELQRLLARLGAVHLQERLLVGKLMEKATVVD